MGVAELVTSGEPTTPSPCTRSQRGCCTRPLPGWASATRTATGPGVALARGGRTAGTRAPTPAAASTSALKPAIVGQRQPRVIAAPIGTSGEQLNTLRGIIPAGALAIRGVTTYSDQTTDGKGVQGC